MQKIRVSEEEDKAGLPGKSRGEFCGAALC